MKRTETAKLVSLIALSLVISLVLFGFGFYTAQSKNKFAVAISTVHQEITSAFSLAKQEASTITGLLPKAFLQPVRYYGDGVTINETTDNDLILLSGFFDKGNELRLIRRNGDTVARWPVQFSDYFKSTAHIDFPPATDWNVDTHGALILPDGSVVFNFEYAGLLKLDRCGDVVWKLNQMTHHSVELAEGGGFWVSGRRVNNENPPDFPPFNAPFYEDMIYKVSADGKLLKQISVPALFYKNNLDILLTSSGSVFHYSNNGDGELVHLNKIAELYSDRADAFPLFDAGDLVLSLRLYNLILVIDPETETIKWHQAGPWKRQHDPEFTEDGKISVFNNNVYSTSFNEFSLAISPPELPRVSNVIEIDPVTLKTEITYGEKVGQELMTIVRGKHQLTDNGGILFTEFEAGRAFEVDATGNIIWEYINRYDFEYVAEITEARVYKQDYFDVTNWSCDD